MKMKILQISPQVPLPLDDGGRLGIYGITKSLAERGHEIHFVCYRKNIEQTWAEKELRKICIPYILNVQTDDKLFSVLLNFFSPVPYNISKFIRKEMEEFLIEFLKKNKVDLVHIDHLHLGWTIDVIRRYSNAPVILREHNFETNIMRRFSGQASNPVVKLYSGIQLNKIIRYEPLFCQKFDKCIMITKKDEQELLTLNHKIKTAVIPAGVEDFLIEKKINTNKIPYSLFHIGSLEWLPNYDGLKWFLEKILPPIVKSLPQVKLYIYGKASDKIFIPKSLSDNVIVEGYVEDIWQAVSDKQLAIVPLRIGSGIRLKILEMLAQGINIISTSVGKEGIDVIDKEHLLVADSADEFLIKTTNFFQDAYKRGDISRNARSLVAKKYSWKIIGELFEKEYCSLIRK